MQLGGHRPAGLPPAVRQSAEWEALRRQIYTHAMRLNGGLTYDFRVLLTDAGHARSAGRLMWQIIKPFSPRVLIGPGFGAAPLLFSTALAAHEDGAELQVLMVRDKRKGYNQKRWIEGNHEQAKGQRAVFIDDFMRHGSALKLVRQALKEEKLALDMVAAALFYDMWDPLVSRQMSVDDFPVVALYTRHDMGLSRDAYDARPPEMRGAFPEFIKRPPRWWRFALNDRKGYPKKCAPLIVGGAVYVADDHSTLWKHDLHSGDVLWSVPSVHEPLKGVVQLLQHVDRSLVYSCYDGTLTRVSMEDGAVQWRRRLDSSIHATPSLDAAHGRVFVNTEQWNEGQPTGHVQCLRLDTGRLVWKHRLGWWPPGSTAYCEQTNVVVAPCNDQTLTALNADNGQPQWTAKTSGLVRGKPLVLGGRVYAATERGRLHCFDLNTGSLLWTARHGKGLMHQFLTAIGKLVFVMDATWHLYAFDADSGKLAWLCRLRSPGCWCPVVYGDYLVVVSEGGHVAVISPRDEVKVWESGLPGTYQQPPAVAEGTLVVASNSAGLVAYDIDSFYSGATA
jgi:outer membrane protein assembly factor BamB/orotate phosphoribosyltransferase